MFWKRKSNVGGYIAFYQLEDWWFSLSEEERSTIQDHFQPGLGSDKITLTEGTLQGSSESAGQFLTILASWFERKDRVPTGLKILEVAKTYCKGVLENHFWYSHFIEMRYKQRNDDPAALDDVIQACEAMIVLAPRAADAFRKAYGHTQTAVPPSHKGFQQLIVIRKKQGDEASLKRLEIEFSRVWR